MKFEELVGEILAEDNANASASSKQTNIDRLQAALDVIGFDPTIGTAADVINTLISALRAACSKESDERTKHIINAGISAISIVPFADILKLLKLKKSRPAVVGAKLIKSYGKSSQKADRFEVSENSIASGADSVFGGGVTSTTTVRSGDNYAPGDARTPKSIYKNVLTRTGTTSRKKRKRK